MEEEKITTIQVNERTLYILKKLKEELKVNSYDEVIVRKITKPIKSMAGFLGKHLTQKEKEEILKDDRKKEDRI